MTHDAGADQQYLRAVHGNASFIRPRVMGTVLLTHYALWTILRLMPVSRSICRTDKPFCFNC